MITCYLKCLEEHEIFAVFADWFLFELKCGLEEKIISLHPVIEVHFDIGITYQVYALDLAFVLLYLIQGL